jgi:quinol monooxygenase YgiN
MKLDNIDKVSVVISQFGAELNDSSKPLTVLAFIRAKSGADKKLESSFAKARIPTLKEKGVISYELNRKAKGDNDFVVYERWESLAALDAHLRMPYVVTLRNEFSELIEGIPEFQVLIPVAD